ncbi:MAG TPA: metal-dependent hydrolase [Candidatus Xenobia bacterium]|nr:metal-dependent hydrolase [Candidatus Xenobia bacterium]
MDPLTHTITAWLVARAGLERAAPCATPTLLVAANIPAVDIVQALGGSTFYLAHSRTWSHSLIGAAMLGAGLGLAFWRLARLRQGFGGQAAPAGRLAALGVAGAFTHLLLDWMTPSGAQLLWPFQRTSYALDWFPQMDLWLFVALVLGVALPGLFRLITEEIGARSTRGGRRAGAWLALAALLALAAGRGVLHSEATTKLEARLYKGRTPLRAGAFPTPLNPLRWTGVVETEDTHERVNVTLLGRVDETEETLYKPAGSPTADRALDTDEARAFLSWARFPAATMTPRVDHGWRAELRDLRGGGDSPVTLRIELDPAGEVESAQFSIRFLLLFC